MSAMRSQAAPSIRKLLLALAAFLLLPINVWLLPEVTGDDPPAVAQSNLACDWNNRLFSIAANRSWQAVAVLAMNQSFTGSCTVNVEVQAVVGGPQLATTTLQQQLQQPLALLLKLEKIQLGVTSVFCSSFGNSLKAFVVRNTSQSGEYICNVNTVFLWSSDPIRLYLNVSSSSPYNASFFVAFAAVVQPVNVCQLNGNLTELRIDALLYAFAPESMYSRIPPNDVACSANATYTLMLAANSSSSRLSLTVLAAPPSNSCWSLLLDGLRRSDGDVLNVVAGGSCMLRYVRDAGVVSASGSRVCADGGRSGFTLRAAAVASATTAMEMTTVASSAEPAAGGTLPGVTAASSTPFVSLKLSSSGTSSPSFVSLTSAVWPPVDVSTAAEPHFTTIVNGEMLTSEAVNLSISRITLVSASSSGETVSSGSATSLVSAVAALSAVLIVVVIAAAVLLTRVLRLRKRQQQNQQQQSQHQNRAPEERIEVVTFDPLIGGNRANVEHHYEPLGTPSAARPLEASLAPNTAIGSTIVSDAATIMGATAPLLFGVVATRAEPSLSEPHREPTGETFGSQGRSPQTLPSSLTTPKLIGDLTSSGKDSSSTGLPNESFKAGYQKWDFQKTDSAEVVTFDPLIGGNRANDDHHYEPLGMPSPAKPFDASLAPNTVIGSTIGSNAATITGASAPLLFGVVSTRAEPSLSEPHREPTGETFGSQDRSSQTLPSSLTTPKLIGDLTPSGKDSSSTGLPNESFKAGYQKQNPHKTDSAETSLDKSNVCLLPDSSAPPHCNGESQDQRYEPIGEAPYSQGTSSPKCHHPPSAHEPIVDQAAPMEKSTPLPATGTNPQERHYCQLDESRMKNIPHSRFL